MGTVDDSTMAGSTVDDNNRLMAALSGHETDKVDPNIIDWDGPNDPANPRNWASLKRNGHVVLVSLFTLNA